MTDYLVGYTGFVGSNLAAAHAFTKCFNSKNISDSFNGHPDILYYAGIPARKFYADSHPAEDLAVINNAIKNIKSISPKKIVLISTIDVLSNPIGATEDTSINETTLSPYGANRIFLENWVKSSFPNTHLIIRLPALFGDNLKKNFIFDILNPIPKLFDAKKFHSLAKDKPQIADYYTLDDSGYYYLNDSLTDTESTNLLHLLEDSNSTALSFTDSRAKYQFYNLKYLWRDLEIASRHNLNLLHLATEPISAGDLYSTLFGHTFTNIITDTPASYDFRSLHANLYHGKSGYLYSTPSIIQDIASFLESASHGQLKTIINHDKEPK